MTDTTKTGSGEDFDGVTISTGFESSGSPLHFVTTYTYDAQGRRVTTKAHDGGVSGSYVSQLADRRLVSLSYPRIEAGSPTKYHGPVGYIVSNLEGKAEASGSVALPGNDTVAAQSLHVDES